jgi:DNA-binding NtrC family response regulator
MKAFVAVVSSEPDFLARVTALLEADGYVVAPYSQAKLALQAFESINFDVLVSTLVLGTHNGFALAEVALARNPRLQVVLASRVPHHAAANTSNGAAFLDYEFTLEAFAESARQQPVATRKALDTAVDIEHYLRARMNPSSPSI